jgi:hypothetical protein
MKKRVELLVCIRKCQREIKKDGGFKVRESDIKTKRERYLASEFDYIREREREWERKR